MKIAIVHLSDIHFRESENIVTERVQGISGVLQSWCSECQGLRNCFIVVSGDLASNGNSKEYDQAQLFLQELRAKICELDAIDQLEYIVVPGNHDCNLRTVSSAREMLTSALLDKEHGPIDDSVINILTSDQQEFFGFLGSLVPGIEFTALEKLYYERKFAIGDFTVKFDCYNTAWMSQREEEPGKIIFPVEKIPKTRGRCNLVCAVLHHPYNWFEPENGKALRRHIEETADIVFTGHEHDPDLYTIQRISGEISDYLEGGILQVPDSNESCLNGAVIDLERRDHKRSQYYWNDVRYLPKYTTVWQPLHVSEPPAQRFENNKSFAKLLDDPGAGFTHRYVGFPRLSDIFVYPELVEINLETATTKFPYETIPGEKLVDYVVNNKLLLIIGANLSGKTSLFRNLYREFLNREYVPVLVNGASITSPKAERISQLVHDAFSEQYPGEMSEEYKQLPKSRRVLFIDDFDLSKLNQKGKGLFLEFVQNMFDRVLISSSDLANVEESAPPVQKSLLSFKHCHIAEFGYLLRRRLIKKWVSLGREYTASEIDLDYEVKNCENQVDRAIGRKLLPSNPFVVLTILQTIEAKVPLKTAAGSYGHLYEFVITNAIGRSSKRVEDMAAKYDFLSELAYYVLEKGIPHVSTEQIREVEGSFYEKYDTRVDSLRMVRELEQVNILSYQDGHYAFKYPHLYHYFTARYMSNNIRDTVQGPDIQAKIQIMSRNLFREEYANVMIFLCYLSRDSLIYEVILRNARDLFSDYRPCDLDKDVSFVNIRHPDHPRILIEEKSVDETSEELLRARDEMSRIIDDTDTTYDTDVVDEVATLDPIMQMNSAFKTMQILGQIVRNFPTALRREVKLDLIEESVSVGLRALQGLYGMIQQDIDEFENDLRRLIVEGFEIEDEYEISDRVRKLAFLIPITFAFGLVKRISFSVGAEELKETYKRLLAKHSSTAMSLVDVSIKLDHFRHPPVDEIVSLHKALKNNPCSATVLALLLVENLFLYHWPYDKRQSVLAHLEIEVTDPRLIEGPSKKLPRD